MAKFAVFKAATEGGATALVVVGVVMSAVTAFFYARVIVLMFFTDPVPDGPTVAVPSGYTAAALGLGLAVTVVLGVLPAAGARPRRPGRAVRAMTPPVRRAGRAGEPRLPGRLGRSTRADPALQADLAAGLAAVEERLREAVESSNPLVTEVSRHLVDAGGKRFRPLLTLLAAQLGDAGRPEVVDAAVVVELTHLASLYHDDVMDEAARAARRRERATPAGPTPSRSSPATTCSPAPPTSSRGSGPRPSGSRPGPSPGSSRARSARPPGPRAGQDPVEHHLQVLADKTGSLIATSARLGAMQSGRPGRRRRPGRGVRRGRSGSPSSCPTTSSTSPARPASRARRPAPTCARASARCRCCSPSPTTPPSTPGCASC